MNKVDTKDSDADFLRDLALQFEENEFLTAKRLVELALAIRPNGTFIRQKVEEYEKLSADNFHSVPEEQVITTSRKIIIHIGTHKTGSSSIQTALYNLGKLYEFFYPKFNYLGKEFSNHSILFFNVFEEYIDILHLRGTFFAKNKLLFDLYQIE